MPQIWKPSTKCVKKLTKVGAKLRYVFTWKKKQKAQKDYSEHEKYVITNKQV